MIFLNPKITLATAADLREITALLNGAYRGESSKKGWTTEAHLIGGNVRTNEVELGKVIKQAGSIVLKYTHTNYDIVGCVNLQQHHNKIYLGMLSVSPQLQGAGIGKQLLIAAEKYAQHQKCTAIYMTVITARTELINWYNRNGYKDTGERKPFIEDNLTGNHLQFLEFMVLEKLIGVT